MKKEFLYPANQSTSKNKSYTHETSCGRKYIEYCLYLSFNQLILFIKLNIVLKKGLITIQIRLPKKRSCLSVINICRAFLFLKIWKPRVLQFHIVLTNFQDLILTCVLIDKTVKIINYKVLNRVFFKFKLIEILYHNRQIHLHFTCYLQRILLRFASFVHTRILHIKEFLIAKVDADSDYFCLLSRVATLKT
jgi:hypothetical protein